MFIDPGELNVRALQEPFVARLFFETVISLVSSELVSRHRVAFRFLTRIHPEDSPTGVAATVLGCARHERDGQHEIVIRSHAPVFTAPGTGGIVAP